MKKGKSTWLLIGLLMLVLGVLAFFVFRLSGSDIKDEKMKVTILKTGKSDAIVLSSEGQNLMIDTGEVDDAEKIVQFLKDEGINTIDAMIITHFDKDHVGGAGLLAETFNVKRVLIPNYEGTIAEYADFMAAMEAALIEPERVADNMDFTLGQMSIRIEPPKTYDINTISNAVEDYDNTLSLMTEVTCGERTFLFAADADKRRLNEWLEDNQDSKFDFLKAPHHGKYNAALENLITAIEPEYAALTCSKKNPADDSVIELFKKYGVNVFQTRDGQITVLTDGSTIKVLQD